MTDDDTLKAQEARERSDRFVTAWSRLGLQHKDKFFREVLEGTEKLLEAEWQHWVEGVEATTREWLQSDEFREEVLKDPDDAPRRLPMIAWQRCSAIFEEVLKTRWCNVGTLVASQAVLGVRATLEEAVKSELEKIRQEAAEIAAKAPKSKPRKLRRKKDRQKVDGG